MIRALGGVLAAAVACAPAPVARGPAAPAAPMAEQAEPAPSAAAAPKDPLPAAVERTVGLFEAIAAIEPTVACPAAAATIDRLRTERADALRIVDEAARDNRAAQLDALYQRAAARLSAALDQVDRLAQRCDGDPAVNAALGRLGGEQKVP